MTLTILAFRANEQVGEFSVDTDCTDYAGIASGVQRERDCGRVIILKDGALAYDTADQKRDVVE